MLFREKRSLQIRIFHWGNAVAFFLTLMLVLIKKNNVFSTKTTDAFWNFHPYVGFVLMGLLLYRLFIYLNERAHPKDYSSKPLFFKLIKAFHNSYYFVLLFMGISGVLVFCHTPLGISHGTSDKISEIHGYFRWFFIFFTLAHFGGVFNANRGEDKGIIRDMLLGEEPKE
jgi:cytochrome b561